METNQHLDIDREAEAHGYANAQENKFDLIVAKQSLIPTFQNNVDLIVHGVENGDINALDAFASFKRIEKIFKDAKDKVDSLAYSEAEKYNEKTFSYSGVKFTVKQGAERLNYEEDEVYFDLKQQLKQREELLKVASRSKEMIFDSNGIEVPKVSSKFDKSSLQLKF